ncbi:MAG: alpha/beta fold hydrolase [Sphingorhabdus sp.]
MRYRRLALLSGIAITAGLAVITLFGNMATRATPSVVGPLAATEQEITLRTIDGVKIAASYFPVASSEAPVILMLHGNGASRNQFKGHAAWLNNAGYAAMAIDFRGHGESQEEAKSFGLFEARDAEAAVAWIKKDSPKAKIGVIGVSLGGAASLLGKDGPLPVDALILKAVYPDIDRAIRNRVATRVGSFAAAIITPLLTYQSPFRYGAWPGNISPVNGTSKFPGPVLVIGGAKDSYTPADESKLLFDGFPGPGQLWIVDGLEHDQISDLGNDVYRQRVLWFLKGALK